jgi:4-alpha-glucanotransferase
MTFHKFAQWVAFEQWGRLRQAAWAAGIRIMGDCPIYVAPDSADVWAHREVFKLDEEGNQTCYAGVPPDYFSPQYGQFWGNPIYRWREADGTLNQAAIEWWTRRLLHQFGLFDELRIDHFRGFAGYWEVPAGKCEIQDETGRIVKSARCGAWISAPGRELFEHVAASCGKRISELPIIAEDLGVITKDVRELRSLLNAPGMGIFQFAQWAKLSLRVDAKSLEDLISPEELPARGISLEREADWERLFYCSDEDKEEYARFLDHEFLPHNAERSGKQVFYPGTHDNETIAGWFGSADRTKLERKSFSSYLDLRLRTLESGNPHIPEHLRDSIPLKVIRVLCATRELNCAIFQMQDILGLPNELDGAKIRTNVPNRTGQWGWKMGNAQVFTPELQQTLSEISRASGRMRPQ